jgi:hypothetical protein
MSMVEKWRAAFVKQLLTPAPDARELAWEQNALARRKYEYTGLKPERLKHAIAEDMAFLAARIRYVNQIAAQHDNEAPAPISKEAQLPTGWPRQSAG